MSRSQTLIPAVAACLTCAFAPIAGHGRAMAGQQPSPSDLEIRQAAGAIEQADGYDDFLAVTTRYAHISAAHEWSR